MKLHHIAIWTFRLEELKEFYVRFFGGKSNEKYINPKKGFESYFISFGEGTDLELMSRTDVQNTPIEENRVGLTHFAFTFPLACPSSSGIHILFVAGSSPSGISPGNALHPPFSACG